PHKPDAAPTASSGSTKSTPPPESRSTPAHHTTRWTAFGVRLLREAGAVDIGEAEHAFKSASLSGELDGVLILAFVYDRPAPSIAGARTVSAFRADGRQVRVSKAGPRILEARFVCDRYEVAIRHAA